MNDFENDLAALLPKAPGTEEANVLYQCGYAAGILAAEKRAAEKQSTGADWWWSRNSRHAISVAFAAACLTAMVAWSAGYRMGNVAKMPAEVIAINATTVETNVQPDHDPQPPSSTASTSPDNVSHDNGPFLEVDNAPNALADASVNNPFADLTTLMKQYVYGDLHRKPRPGRTREYLTSRTMQDWARPFVPINGIPSTMLSTSTGQQAAPYAMESDTPSRPAEDLDATISRPTRANPDAWLNWIQ